MWVQELQCAKRNNAADYIEVKQTVQLHDLQWPLLHPAATYSWNMQLVWCSENQRAVRTAAANYNCNRKTVRQYCYMNYSVTYTNVQHNTVLCRDLKTSSASDNYDGRQHGSTFHALRLHRWTKQWQ